MRTSTLVLFVSVLAALGCDSATRLGERCSNHSDCSADLQCLHSQCVSRCAFAFECGEGMTCHDGECRLAEGKKDAQCTKEWDCKAGLTCTPVLEDSNQNGWADGARCTEERSADTPISGTCSTDSDCRWGMCIFDRCTPICGSDEDCPPPHECSPLSKPGEPRFRGCTEPAPPRP